MASWRTLKNNIHTNIPTQDVINNLLDYMTGDVVQDANYSGTQAITGSLKIVGIASGAVANITAAVQTTPYAFILSGSHVRPGATSGGVVGEWRVMPPYLFVCTGAMSGNWMVFTGAQV